MTHAQGQDVLVRYLSDSIRLVEHALRKNATGDLAVSVGRPVECQRHQGAFRRS